MLIYLIVHGLSIIISCILMEKVKKIQKQKNLEYSSISGLYFVALWIPVMSIPVIYSALEYVSHKRARTPEEAEEQRKRDKLEGQRRVSGGNGWETWGW